MLQKYLSRYAKPLFLLALTLLPSFAVTTPAHMPHDRYSSLTCAGDTLSLAMPALAVIAGLQRYRQGQCSGAAAMAPVLAVAAVGYSTDFLKRCMRSTSLGTRPNGYHSSFSSAHSSYAFIGARLIHKAFGINYGIPAYGLAVLTAYSRVEGHYHHTRDVVAGALLSFLVDAVCDSLSARSAHPSFFRNFAVTPAYGTGLRIEYRF